MYWLALLGAVLTVVALYYYLVVASRMYIDRPVRPAAVVLAARCSSRSSSARWAWS